MAEQIIQTLCEAYFETVSKVIQNTKPGEGLFGVGGPQRNPCHMDFYEQVKAAAAEVCADDADGFVEALLRADADHPEQPEMVKLTLVAVQGLAEPLVPAMTPEKAKELQGWYGKQYSLLNRMPVQKNVLKALKRRAKE